MSNTPILDQLLVGFPQQLQKLHTEISDPTVFDSAELLLSAAESLGVLGIEKLAQPISGSKFASLLSELRIANLFSSLGYSVSILPDEAFGRNGTYTPDLLVATSFCEILIEVASGSPGSVDMSSLIQEGLTEYNLCFRTTDYLAEDLCIPGVTAEERNKVAEQAKTTASKFIEHLKNLSPLDRGSIEIDGTRFEYEPSPTQKGYHSGGVTAFHSVRTEKHKEKLLRELAHKASKQRKLPPDKRATPFIVAYDNREPELDPLTAHSTLTGSRCCYLAPPEKQIKYYTEKRAAYPEDLLSALSGPWRCLMEDWDYGPHSRCYKQDFGALFEKEWARHISGILLMHVRDIIQWFPNPFAAQHLRTPQLMEIQLPTTPSYRGTFQ